MELLQIYNRRTNTWSNKKQINVGYAENWKLDKSTDTLTDVKLWYFGKEAPDWRIMDWARIIYAKDKNDVATYTQEGLPDNHSQYIISGIQFIREEMNDKWIIDITFSEPIERFRGILGETLSYTNQTEKIQDGITYTKATYNHLTALERWLKVTPANCDNYGSGYNPKLNISWYNRIRILDKEWLESLPFADTTFNELSLYNVLLDNFDSSTGRTPVAYFDLNTNPTETRYSVEPVRFVNSHSNTALQTADTAFVGYLNYKIDEVMGFVGIDEIPKGADGTIFANFIEGEVYTLFAKGEDDTFTKYITAPWDKNLLEHPAYFQSFRIIKTDMDLPNNPDRDEYLLKFERQDGFDKPVIDFDTLMAKDIEYPGSEFLPPIKHSLTGRYFTHEAVGNYATGLISNIENLSVGSGINFPAQGLYCVPEVDIDKRDLTGFGATNREWVLRMPHPIKRVTKLEKLEMSGWMWWKDTLIENLKKYYLTTNKIDLTSKLLERKQYLADDSNGDPALNYDLLWYTEGENLIHVKDYYYNDDRQTAMYYVEYEPLINARVQVGDFDFVQQVNQSFSQVDNQKYSAFLREYLGGMAKADLVIDKVYSVSVKDFKDLFGCRVKRGDKEYIITNISYRNRNFDYDVVFQLNENHTRKNNSYQANQETRKNMAIGYENIQQRRSVIKQTVKIGLTPQTQSGYGFLLDNKVVLSALIQKEVPAEKYPQVAMVNIKSGLSNYPDRSFLANVAQFQFGNQVNLNVQFLDNALAGWQKVAPPIDDKEPGRDEGEVRPFVDVKKQMPILYTDPFGEAEKVDLIFSRVNEDNISIGVSGETTKTIFNIAETSYATMQNLPYLSEKHKAQILDNTIARISDQVLMKDQLEMFNNSLCIEVKSDDMIVCDNLLRFSRLMNPIDGFGLHLYGNKAPLGQNDFLLPRLFQRALAFYTVNEDSISYRFTPLTESELEQTESITILANQRETLHKLLIINNLSATIKSQLANGELIIYF